MKTLVNKSWISYLLIFLLTINLAALGTIIYFSYKHNQAEHTIPEPPMDIRGGEIMDSLGLNAQQREFFMESRQRFKERGRPMMQEMQHKKRQIIQNLDTDTPDTVLLNSLADEMGALNAELKKNAIRHLIELRKECTPDQKEKMKEVSRAMFRSTDGAGPGGGMQHRHGWKRGGGPGRNRPDSLQRNE